MRKHLDCQHFGYRSCKYADTDIMKMAKPNNTPKYEGGNYSQMMISTPHDKIDKLCSDCDQFTPYVK